MIHSQQHHIEGEIHRFDKAERVQPLGKTKSPSPFLYFRLPHRLHQDGYLVLAKKRYHAIDELKADIPRHVLEWAAPSEPVHEVQLGDAEACPQVAKKSHVGVVKTTCLVWAHDNGHPCFSIARHKPVPCLAR